MPATVSDMLPESIASVEQLDDLLSAPPPYVVDLFRRMPGDVVVLGAAGKMGPTLARMARRALDAAGSAAAACNVVGVSRYSNPREAEKLERWGIRIVRGDLLDEKLIASLPDAPHVIYMAGMKFGSTGNEPATWASNAYLPALVCRRYPRSRIVAFSTGNVYGLTPVALGGPGEDAALNPQGEYAMSCLGRERMFEYFSARQTTPVTVFRLNYACELRYGVLVDLAQRVWAGDPIDLRMGTFNVIWQGDANAMALASLELAEAPPAFLNCAGPRVLRVREVCEQLAALMGKAVRFENTEADDALLSNGSKGWRLYSEPTVTEAQLIRWVGDWVKRGGESLGKPTHFEARDGKF